MSTFAFAFVFVFAFAILMKIADKFIEKYADRKYEEWTAAFDHVYKEHKEERCFDCPIGYYFMVFSHSSEFKYPLPMWTRKFKTYGCTFSRRTLVSNGPLMACP